MAREGRPPKAPEDRNIRVNISLPADLREKRKALAERQILSRICAKAIREAKIPEDY